MIQHEMTAPLALIARKNWVLRKGKKPVDINGRSIGWNTPEFWLSWKDATSAAAADPEKFDGIGFIVSEDPVLGDKQIIGGDIDCCRDPVTGQTSPWAIELLNSLKSPVSISISGTGLRFFCLGKLPDDKKVFFNGPDDLTPEVREHILAVKPDLKDKLAKGEPAWNGVEIYADGPRHLTVTGEWLPDYPSECEDRTEELESIIRPVLEKKKLLSTVKINIPKKRELPELDICSVIDTNGFKRIGKELVGAHPVFGSTNNDNLKVNTSSGVWHCFHRGAESGGDAWCWLACECGAIDWREAGSGALKDPEVIRKTKEHALKRGLVPEDVLFPERAATKKAVAAAIALKDPV